MVSPAEAQQLDVAVQQQFRRVGAVDFMGGLRAGRDRGQRPDAVFVAPESVQERASLPAVQPGEPDQRASHAACRWASGA